MAAVSDVIVVEHGELRWGDRRAPLAAVRGLREVYSAWTGRAFLCVDGPQWKVPIGEGYAAARESLRRALPDVPMTGDWMDGRFPGAPFGLPPALVLTAAVGLAAGLAGAAAWVGGWPWGLAVAGLAAWPLGRLRDGWVVHVEGLRGGPPWGPWRLGR